MQIRPFFMAGQQTINHPTLRGIRIFNGGAVILSWIRGTSIIVYLAVLPAWWTNTNTRGSFISRARITMGRLSRFLTSIGVLAPIGRTTKPLNQVGMNTMPWMLTNTCLVMAAIITMRRNTKSHAFTWLRLLPWVLMGIFSMTNGVITIS
jgi:hypothetical protein